jgi:hypothetical protein
LLAATVCAPFRHLIQGYRTRSREAWWIIELLRINLLRTQVHQDMVVVDQRETSVALTTRNTLKVRMTVQVGNGSEPANSQANLLDSVKEKFKELNLTLQYAW